MPKAILSAFEAEQILKVPDLSTPRGLRDRAILETLYATGVRRQELAALKIDDIDLENGRLMVRQGKGKRDRLLPLSERACAWIEKYLEESRFHISRGADDGSLFISHIGKRMHPEQMTKIVRRSIEAAEIEKPGACHLFRHTLATLMLEGGADLRYVQAMLGHADISTTQIYTRVAIGKLQEALEKSHPGAKLGRRAKVAVESENVEDPRAAFLEQARERGRRDHQLKWVSPPAAAAAARPPLSPSPSPFHWIAPPTRDRAVTPADSPRSASVASNPRPQLRRSGRPLRFAPGDRSKSDNGRYQTSTSSAPPWAVTPRAGGRRPQRSHAARRPLHNAPYANWGRGVCGLRTVVA